MLLLSSSSPSSYFSSSLASGTMVGVDVDYCRPWGLSLILLCFSYNSYYCFEFLFLVSFLNLTSYTFSVLRSMCILEWLFLLCIHNNQADCRFLMKNYVKGDFFYLSIYQQTIWIVMCHFICFCISSNLSIPICLYLQFTDIVFSYTYVYHFSLIYFSFADALSMMLANHLKIFLSSYKFQLFTCLPPYPLYVSFCLSQYFHINLLFIFISISVWV